MRQPIDVSLHVINVLAGGETIKTDKNTLTRQQDRVSAAKSPCESSPKPSLGNCVKNICLVV
jgi:hypothetical protein